MPVKVLDSRNLGTWMDVSQGILFAVDNGADIINLSLGSPRQSQTVAAALDYAEANGVLVVAAAGNLGSDEPFYPAAFETVLAVNATDDDDMLWPLSNTGPNVDLSAPGHVIYSTYHDLDNYFDGYGFMSGTSMAAPHVAGVAGLLLSVNPRLTQTELIKLLTSTAVDLGQSGHDAQFGAGRLNAAGAVAAAVATAGSHGHTSVEQPISGQPDEVQPGVDQSGTEQTGTEQSGTEQSGIDVETSPDAEADQNRTSAGIDEAERLAARDAARKTIFLPMVVNR